MILDTSDRQKSLPHRFPCLLIDKVVKMERYKRIVAIKNVSINEAFFQGHFPGKPIMPGVLILEAMAQAGGMVVLQENPDPRPKLPYLAPMNNVVFPRHAFAAAPLGGEVRSV